MNIFIKYMGCRISTINNRQPAHTPIQRTSKYKKIITTNRQNLSCKHLYRKRKTYNVWARAWAYVIIIERELTVNDSKKLICQTGWNVPRQATDFFYFAIVIAQCHCCCSVLLCVHIPILLRAFQIFSIKMQNTHE